MSEMLIAGQPVDRGIFSQGRNRNWFAEVVLATSEDEEPPTGPVELSLLGTTWQGFAVRSGAPYQQARLRIIGGRGGLTTRINPRDYRVASYRQILTELLEDAGEELNVENSVGLDDMLAGWSRFRQAAVVELEQLVACGHGLRLGQHPGEASSPVSLARGALGTHHRRGQPPHRPTRQHACDHLGAAVERARR